MPSENSQSRTSVQSIVRRPWEFACQWYDVDDIHRCITQKLQPAFGGNIDIPSDVASREFAEWLADQYRLAMRKGAELATNEMRDAIESKFRHPDTYIATYERDGWDHARRSVERWLEGDD